MSTSTDAILFYGYCWDDETLNPCCWDDAVLNSWNLDEDNSSDDEDSDDNDWETRYAKLKGLSSPTVPYPDRPWNVVRGQEHYTPAELAIIQSYQDYFAAKRLLIKASGVEIGFHCADSAPMPYVCIRASEITNHRGSMTVITQDTLAIGTDWNRQLAEFCALMGINTDGKQPTWYMVSWWS